jgi:hypothetical protein
LTKCCGFVKANPVSTKVRARRAAVVGILWPSKKFDEASLTAGGAAAMGPNDADALKQSLDLLTSFVGTPDAAQSLARAAALDPLAHRRAAARKTSKYRNTGLAKEATKRRTSCRRPAQSSSDHARECRRLY